MQGVDGAISQGFDTTAIDNVRRQVDLAGAGLQDLNNNISQPPHIPQPPAPPPVQWQGSSNIEVFTGNGISRFEQEMASTNQMMNQVTANQQRISQLSNSTNPFPDNMTADLQIANTRIEQLRSRIEQINRNPIGDMGADAVNNNFETLRGHLNQALAAQNDLTTAMDRMDVSGANAAYNRLNNIVDTTDIHIRENTNAQNEFNRRVNSGSSSMSGLTNKIMAMASAFIRVQTVGNVMNLSDSMSQTEARLSMTVDDGGSVDELQQKIYASSQASRADYMTTANMVAQLGQRASDAFTTNDETIAFAENLNKSFVIAGASQQEIASATLQLTQALGSGVLRGEELNAVFESAPNVIQNIADYMDVPIGAIRNMASEGQITADIVKNSMLSATDKIDAQFNAMPVTFSQAWSSIQGDLLMTFQPMLESIAQVAGWIHENWASIEPVFWGVATAVGAYALITGIQTAATWLSVSANRALIVTMLSNPVLWIAIAIGMLIAVIYQWVQSVGGIEVAWKIAMDGIIKAWDWTCIGLMTGVYWVMNKFNEFQLMGATVSTNFQNFMSDMETGTLMILQSMVNGAIDIINDFTNVINSVTGASFEAIAHVTFGTTAEIENEATKSIRNVELAMTTGVIEANISARDTALEQMKTNAMVESAQRQNEIDKLQYDAFSTVVTGSGYDASSPAMDEIAYNTGAMADSVTTSTEDLKYMRDIAERDVVNRYTTAEIKVDMTNNNNVSSGMDLNGMVDSLAVGVYHAMDIAAEGVHY